MYAVVVRAYGLGTELMPAPAAMSWKATAEAVHRGFAAMPDHAPEATLVAVAAGGLLGVLSRTSAGRYFPSPVAMGMGFVVPPSFAPAALSGALAGLMASRARPAWSRTYLFALAAGGVAGESLLGILLALYLVLGP
jgi:uncharacterized oligopeptide transporter (OPT) family protein